MAGLDIFSGQGLNIAVKNVSVIHAAQHEGSVHLCPLNLKLTERK